MRIYEYPGPNAAPVEQVEIKMLETGHFHARFVNKFKIRWALCLAALLGSFAVSASDVPALQLRSLSGAPPVSADMVSDIAATVELAQADFSVNRSNTDTSNPLSGAPEISRVRVALISDASAQITWSLDQPASGVIEYGQTKDLTLASPPEKSFKYSAHRQILKDLIPGTEYFFQIVSSNRAGEETRSDIFSFTKTALEQDESSIELDKRSLDITTKNSQTESTVKPTSESNTDSEAELKSELQAELRAKLKSKSESPVELQQRHIPTKNPVQKALTTSVGSASAGWPERVYDSLPLAGIFYGNYKAGLMSGNGPLAAQNAVRFRAERTGKVNAIRYNNRRILPTDIAHRCKLYGKGSPWCNCKDNNLDSSTCGYTLSNAYHVGTGGLITLELRSDDGTSKHLPSSTVLARTDAYKPAELSDKFPTLALTTPVDVKAGQIYHIVFHNATPPSCDVRKLSAEAAAECPRDEGAMSMNGTKHSGDESDGSRFGPFLGDISGRILFKPKTDSDWLVNKDVIAFYELRYTDGEYVGNSYTGFDNRLYTEEKGGSQVIEGDIVGRQVFTVEDATREVDGLWLNYGHAYDRPTNEKPLSIIIKDADGQIMTTASMPASMACSTRAQIGAGDKPVRANRDEWMCRKWGYSELSMPVSLIQGSSYYIEFSAPQGAAFALSTYFSAHRLPERNIWDNARAEISRDAGTSWQPWTGNNYASRDLPVVFTIVGMPRALP